MRRNRLRVIQISGLRGLLSAGFFVTCLIAGFVWFPALSLNKLWNLCAQNYGVIPYINMFQGLILWAILAVSYVILNRKQHYLVTYNSKSSSKDIKDILEEIKSQRTEIKKVETQKTFETQEIKIQNTTEDSQKSEEKSKEVV